VKHALIVVELALVIVLVGAATAFGVGARSFLHRDLGWQPDGVFSGDVVLPANRYRDDNETRAFHRALLERLAALPGVAHVALARRLPTYSLEGMARTTRLVAEGQPLPESGREPTAEVDSVSPDFFAALRIPLKQGSLFAPGLQPDAPPVVVINEACAQRLWPGENPVGRRLRFVPGDPWFEVIGVVGDVRMAVRLDEPETRLQLYRPQVQAPTRRTSIVLRSATPPEVLTDTVRQTVAALDADLPLTEAGSLRAGLERRFFNFNLVILNLGISAGHGLLIATIGLFGVISQLTVQRTRDIGLRIALGATSRSILRLIVGEGAKMLAVGIALGVPLFYALHILLHRMMPEMQLPGWWLLATDLAVLATTMLVAAWLPARRAARVDPIVALRME
jgi:predicted permease